MKKIKEEDGAEYATLLNYFTFPEWLVIGLMIVVIELGRLIFG